MELLANYSAVQLAAALAAALVSAFVRGLTGFGMAILLVPILALALPPLEAVLLGNFLGLFIGLTEIRRYRRHAEKSALTISAFVFVTTPLGLFALAATSPDMARFLIAMIALSAFFAILLPRRAAEMPGHVATGSVGIVSGLMTGFAGMPGPPVVPFYVGRAIARETAKASMLMVFTAACIAGLVSGGVMGLLEWRLLALATLLFPAILVGNWLGQKASGHIGDAVWRALVGLILAGAAGAALVRLV
ncbi:sulfite exporter TauE/SafE family protein [Qipengyuania zhejiangensis]|uniref:sulfite exporter TauE/SafE family protein n=1 Tax=Qipengyuania zhejiangensis TaxID=3077782 RepID=UPI002D795C8D|nr:sulfite exporter TauE/SafE family protein [Qipengyuania sp. Z2]